MRRWLGEKLRELADGLNPPQKQSSSLSSNLTIRARVLCEEAKRNKLHWQPDKWISTYVYDKLTQEFPRTSRQRILKITRTVCG